MLVTNVSASARFNRADLDLFELWGLTARKMLARGSMILDGKTVLQIEAPAFIDCTVRLLRSGSMRVMGARSVLAARAAVLATRRIIRMHPPHGKVKVTTFKTDAVMFSAKSERPLKLALLAECYKDEATFNPEHASSLKFVPAGEKGYTFVVRHTGSVTGICSRQFDETEAQRITDAVLEKLKIAY